MAVHDFTFPTGFHKFHRKSLYNFQFNRWHSLGFARYEDMVEAGKRINDFDQWKTVMTELAEHIFEKDTHADNHCQIGNIGLAMETVIEWLDEQVR